MFAVVHIYNKPLDLIFKISTTRVFLVADEIEGKLGITFCAFETKKGKCSQIIYVHPSIIQTGNTKSQH